MLGRLWIQGIRPTVFLLVVVILLIWGINAVQSLEVVLHFFLPENLVFWGLPFLLVICIVMPLMGIVTAGKLGGFIGERVENIPLLNMVFTQGKRKKLTEKSFPGVIEIITNNFEIYFYVFVTGTSDVINEKGEVEKTLVSFFPPSLPLIFTSLIAGEVNIKNVKKVEVPGDNGNDAVAIIQKKFIGFGQPLGDKLRHKEITREEIRGHILSKKAESADK